MYRPHLIRLFCVITETSVHLDYLLKVRITYIEKTPFLKHCVRRLKIGLTTPVRLI
jgi:hypothetical protein